VYLFEKKKPGFHIKKKKSKTSKYEIIMKLTKSANNYEISQKADFIEKNESLQIEVIFLIRCPKIIEC